MNDVQMNSCTVVNLTKVVNDKPLFVWHVLVVGLCFVDDLDRDSLMTQEHVCNTDAKT